MEDAEPARSGVDAAGVLLLLLLLLLRLAQNYVTPHPTPGTLRL